MKKTQKQPEIIAIQLSPGTGSSPDYFIKQSGLMAAVRAYRQHEQDMSDFYMQKSLDDFRKFNFTPFLKFMEKRGFVPLKVTCFELQAPEFRTKKDKEREATQEVHPSMHPDQTN